LPLTSLKYGRELTGLRGTTIRGDFSLAVDDRISFLRSLNPKSHAVYFREDEEDGNKILSAFAKNGFERKQPMISLTSKSREKSIADAIGRILTDEGSNSKMLQGYTYENLHVNFLKAPAAEVLDYVRALIVRKSAENVQGVRFYVEFDWLVENQLQDLALQVEQMLGARLKVNGTMMCVYDAMRVTEDDGGSFFRKLLGLHSDAIFRGLGVNLIK
jgi:hypothetical protein